MISKEKEILETAEQMVREGGYNAFSFRVIAQKVGIKSSSVHYHFPTKEDLGAAVVAYYTDKFIEQLGQPEALHAAGKDPIECYIQAFKAALKRDKRMCLCGLLGAELNGLPPAVAEETKRFFERNIEWLTQAFILASSIEAEGAKEKATQTLALLEGLMIVGNVMADDSVFDKVGELLNSNS